MEKPLAAEGQSRGIVELVLVRHGESVGNVADREAIAAKAHRLDLEARDADVELSEEGQKQADALGEHLASLPKDQRPTIVVSSPYQRARSTAERALAALDLEVVIDERIRERELGIFDGVTWYGIEATHPEESARRARVGKFYYRPPGGESWADVILRVRSILVELQERFHGERVWLFSHEAVILAFRYVVWIVALAFTTMPVGLASGTLTALIMDSAPIPPGAASAVAGVVMAGLGAAMPPIVGLGGDRPGGIMALALLVAAVLALGTFLVGIRPPGVRSREPEFAAPSVG